jgi:hypothetical protein
MSFVVINDEELIKRGNVIRRFLRPIANEKEVACTAVAIEGGRILAAHDGLRTARQYRDWRFRTTFRDIQCQYFELWSALASGRQWALDRAYLHVFLIDRDTRQENELIAVHADPNNVDADPLRTIRKGPHLHVKRLESWMQRAHFSLTLGYVDRAVASAAEFTRVVSEAIALVGGEVIDRAKNG